MDNIFVAVNDVTVQQDDKGLFFIHIGQQGMTGVTLDQVSDMNRALSGLLTAAME